jgi:hypothetical protein
MGGLIPMSRSRIGAAVLALVLALQTGSGVRAAEPDKYLPGDTEQLVTINFRQILDSALVKKFGLDMLRDLIKSEENVSEVLKDLGLDPFKDLEKLQIAGPADVEGDKALMILSGKFDVEKFKTAGEKAAKDHGEVVKIHKITVKEDPFLVYEVNLPDAGQTIFVSVVDKTTILGASAKDYLIDALKTKGKKQEIKSAAFKDLLGKVDEQQSVSMVAVTKDLAKAVKNAGLPETIGASLDKIEVIAGGITLTNEVKLEFALGTKKAQDAKDLNNTINNGLNAAIGLLGLAAGGNAQLEPVLDMLKTVKSTAKDKVVTIKGKIDAEMIDKIRKQ